MAASKDRQLSDETQAENELAEKPKSSAGRRMVLLLLLLATVAVFSLDFLPEENSESTLVGPPARKARPPVQAPAQPGQQQPSAPAPAPQQPKASPAPPRYEPSPTTVFVSSSPSDVPTPVSRPTDESVAAVPPNPVAPEPTPVADPTVVPSAPVEAATEPSPAAAETAAADTPAPAVAVESAAPPAPIESPSPAEMVASRSPAPAQSQDEAELVIVVGKSDSAPKAAARPLPDIPIPAKVHRYVQQLLDHYDTNGDGVVDATEQRQMKGDPSAIDYSADGKISLDELAAYTADFGRHRRMRLTGSMVEDAALELPPLYIPTAEREAMAAAQAAQQATPQTQEQPVVLIKEGVDTDDEPAEKEGDETQRVDEPEKTEQPQAAHVNSKRFVTPKSRLAGLPEWFLSKDGNGDGQLTVAEFAPDSDKALLTQFDRYDRNQDGVLTARECPK